MKKITVNGEPEETAASDYKAFLEYYEIPQETVIIQRNGVILQKEEYAVSSVEQGDIVELISIVGGG